jgi:hypothetical protein
MHAGATTVQDGEQHQAKVNSEDSKTPIMSCPSDDLEMNSRNLIELLRAERALLSIRRASGCSLGRIWRR